MNVRIKFLGGAGSVTGSKFLLEVDDFKLLIDCGLFQGIKELRLRNWDSLPVDTASINAVILTHAHIDHTGYLPKLVKEGFNGPIYCTEPTFALMEIMLRDAAKLQEEEADFAKKKGYSKHKNPLALFTSDDTEKVFPLIKSFSFEQEFNIDEKISASFINSGHILGAASIQLKLKGSHQQKIIAISGDIGPYDSPLHFPPKNIGFADILLIESTYGNRTLDTRNIEQQIKAIIENSDQRNGCLIIPAFSVGRTQLILYYLSHIFSKNPNLKRAVYIDSPMAISVTNLYKQYSREHKLEDNTEPHYIFDDPNFHYINSSTASRSLNNIKSRAIIVSASGMVTGGRILHHLYHRLRRESDTILFTGYQAIGSRGRTIISKEKSVKIFGEEVSIKANIEEIHGLSAHADRLELEKWLEGIPSAPKMTFIVHGEKDSAEDFNSYLSGKNWNSFIPNYLESFELFTGI